MSFRRWTSCNNNRRPARVNFHRRDNCYIHKGPTCHRRRFLCNIGKNTRASFIINYKSSIQEHSLEKINIQKTQITLSKKVIQNDDHLSPNNIREHASKKSLWKIFQPQVLYQSSTQYWLQRNRRRSVNQTSLTFTIVSCHNIEIAVRSMVVVLSNQIINPNFNLELIQIHIHTKLEAKVG